MYSEFYPEKSILKKMITYITYLFIDASESFYVVVTAELQSDHLRYPGFVLVAEHRYIVHSCLEVETLSVYDLIKVGHHEHAHHPVAVEYVKQTAFTS